MRFIDKPPAPRDSDYTKITEALEANPQQWAEIREGPSNLIGAYASRYRARDPRFEFTQRSAERGSGRSVLYGRFVG